MSQISQFEMDPSVTKDSPEVDFKDIIKVQQLNV